MPFQAKTYSRAVRTFAPDGAAYFFYEEMSKKEKLLIYQVFTRLYGNPVSRNVRGGSLAENGSAKMNGFTLARLRRIAACGYTHIWYTGLLEHATATDYTSSGIAHDNPLVVKGAAGSPYAVKDYYDIDPDLAVDVPGRMKEFSRLVDRTHRAGLRMIMDFVPNHVARQYGSDARPAGVRDLGEDDDRTKAFSPQNNFYYIPGETLRTDFRPAAGGSEPYVENPARATGNDRFDASPSRDDWYETVKLNYGVDYLGGRSSHFSPVPDTWEKMTAILKYWAAKGVDGFRCDMAEMVPAEFWDYAIAAVRRDFPGIVFIAEIYNPQSYRRYIGAGFDYLYDKVGLYDTLRAVVCGQASASAVTGAWQGVDDIRGHMLNFLENHDEQRIASRFFAGDARRAFPAAVVSATMGGNPFMVYAGQELGEPAADAEGFSGADGRTTIFDYWNVGTLSRLFALQKAGDERKLPEAERGIYDFYRRLTTLCHESEAIAEGAFFDLQYANYDRSFGYDCDRQYAFFRRSAGETLLVVANFAAEAVRVGVNIPRHAFECLSLAEGTRSAADALGGPAQTVELRPHTPAYVEVPGYGAAVLRV